MLYLVCLFNGSDSTLLTDPQIFATESTAIMWARGYCSRNYPEKVFHLLDPGKDRREIVLESWRPYSPDYYGTIYYKDLDIK
jgi:hypothetical protein